MDGKRRIFSRTTATVAAALLGSPSGAQLIDPGRLPGDIGGRAGGALERIGGTVDRTVDEVDDDVRALEATADAALDDIDRIAAAATELFLGNEDPEGRAIERDIWVVLVPNEYADEIPGWGFSIRERRNLEGLDLVLLRVEAPDDRSMTETELELANDAPGTVVDFNHVYGPTDEDEAGTLAGRPASDVAAANVAMPAGSLTLGLVDSAIAAGHHAFDRVTVLQDDFVPFAGERPREHGTAVASIAVNALRRQVGDRPLGIFGASVFFETEDGVTTATTGSLVAALEWLGSRGVRVINMSLAGPPNRVLEAALAAVARRGTIVIAAVGNDGPTAPPLYPAAYESVIGVTAVDADRRVYRRANRGRQVSFAASGVRVEVARPDGRYRRDSGTSLAAPTAAAVIAAALDSGDETGEALIRRLEQEAIDLGDAGFDETYGHGLIGSDE